MGTILTRGIIAAMLATCAAVPAQALIITSIEIRSAVPGEWLQVTELQAFDGGLNVALASQGGVATASSVYPGSVSTPDKAIDGVTNGDYTNNCANVAGGCGFHSAGTGSGEFLKVTLAAPSDITLLTIFGRTDCCSNRDSYSYKLFNGAQEVATGLLDARTSHVASATFVRESQSPVPEPASWALMIGGFSIAGSALRRTRNRRLSFT